MAILKITASRPDMDRLVNAVALNFGYPETIGDPPVPNPQSKDEFTTEKLIETLRDWASGGEVVPDQEALRKKRRQAEREIKELDIEADAE